MKLHKIIHLYWGQNQPLSYFRYLTVKTFAKFNPDWQINVWTPTEVCYSDAPWRTGEQSGEYIGHDYIENLSEYRKEINFESIGVPNNIPEVHKSDLLRWYLLGQYGGIWSDFDIIYIRPLSENIIGLWDGPGLCYYELPFGNEKNHKFQAIGFLASASSDGQEFFTKMFQSGVKKIPQTEYQAFGAMLLERDQLPAWQSQKKSVFYIDKNLVYPYYSHSSVQLYFKNAPLQIQNSIGLHWYAGHPVNGRIAATITQKNIVEKAADYSICKEALKVI